MTEIVNSEEYGEEAVLKLANGYELRTNAGAVGEKTFGGEYIRVVDEDGVEVEAGYWHSTEFEREPEVIIGAIFGSASGIRVLRDVCPSCGSGAPYGRRMFACDDEWHKRKAEKE